MILGLGSDIAHIPRFIAIASGPRAARMASRVLHPSHEAPKFHALLQTPTAANGAGTGIELAAKYLATCWAVKEALYKTLDPIDQAHCRFNKWHRESVLPVNLKQDSLPNVDRFRKPTIINNRYSEKHPKERFHLTISHDGEYVFATVIREQVSI
ncbi:uncharacterized protein SAPINGB_P001961 [Magnusiomyces paraingens]|uniref:4'-phosphopantetheinyl transferase domain-containing protein n=1 Tax=Magnusiomyces paraingens TaxID=2606893 RepID=A0A5E8BH31_9ASCO|nr:uncharacterized protein SAPINGB_P001961 [Saprochaete ingens]VVT48807.1 unnamed protein product [Saprochaete ingens]